MKIGVLDYGSGNLHSACRALAAAGGEVVLTSSQAELLRCDKLVLPGVGAFDACVAQLRAAGGDEFVSSWVAQGRDLLGICVGHQVLFEQGVEGGQRTAGLGLLPGTVERLESRVLPHMGWNLVTPTQTRGLPAVMSGLEDERVYFVHSYAVRDAEDLEASGASVGLAEHGGDRFVACLQRDGVTSTQFHPEKSGEAGARLLRNWIG